MAIDIFNLLAAISPSTLCAAHVQKDVIKTAKSEGYLAAAKKAIIVDPSYFELSRSEYGDPFELPGNKVPFGRHILHYNSNPQFVAPLHIWIVDSLTEKMGTMSVIQDTLEASPGGRADDLSTRAEKMLLQADKVLKNGFHEMEKLLELISLFTRLKPRLDRFIHLDSKDNNERAAAMEYLKRYWLENIDTKAGEMALLRIAQMPGNKELLEYFMNTHAYKITEKRIVHEGNDVMLKTKLIQFSDYCEATKHAVQKHIDSIKLNIKNTVEKIRLYSTWMKPFVAHTRNVTRNGEMVTYLPPSFQSGIYEVILIGKKLYDIEDAVAREMLPKMFNKMNLRRYYSIVLVQMRSRIYSQGARSRKYDNAKTIIDVSSFALNEQELALFSRELNRDSFLDALIIVGGVPKTKAQTIQKEIEDIIPELDNDILNDEREKSRRWRWSNIFSWGPKGKSADFISSDNQYEKVIRSEAIINARIAGIKFYKDLKGQFGMSTV